MEISKIPTTVRNVQGWYEKSIVRNVYGTNSLWYEKSGNRSDTLLLSLPLCIPYALFSNILEHMRRYILIYFLSLIYSGVGNVLQFIKL